MNPETTLDLTETQAKKLSTLLSLVDWRDAEMEELYNRLFDDGYTDDDYQAFIRGWLLDANSVVLK